MITIDPGSAPGVVKRWLDTVQPEINADIERRIGALSPDYGRLCEAMRYAALSPGKRLRPALVLAACEAVGASRAQALPAASAVEMLHAYTLVHDDLPAMDDDEVRRGQPTVHVAFGEAIAILAGDGLLTAAFLALADLGARAADAVAVLAGRAGVAELLSGQALDLSLAERGSKPAWDELLILHQRKTAALFAAATELGGIAGDCSAAQRRDLARYGMAVGVAFQHADDRDDAEHGEYAAKAAEHMRALTTEAAAIAEQFGESGRVLLAMATWMGDVA
jgi:geranylgeranyl pyrophosphate synthase